MTLPGESGRKRSIPRLGPKARLAIAIIRERFAAGEPLSKTLIQEAHKEAYGITDRKALSTYCGQNLRRSAFRQALVSEDCPL